MTLETLANDIAASAEAQAKFAESQAKLAENAKKASATASASLKDASSTLKASVPADVAASAAKLKEVAMNVDVNEGIDTIERWQKGDIGDGKRR